MHRSEIPQKLAQMMSDTGAPSGELLAMVQNPEAGIKNQCEALRHPNIPVDFLRRLTTDDATEIARRAGDQDFRDVRTTLQSFRWEVARHPNSTPEILHALAELDEGLYDRDIALHPRVTPELLWRFAREKRGLRAVAANPQAPPDLLAELYDSGNEQVLRGLAVNPNAPVEALIGLANDDNPYIRRLAIPHPRLPRKTLLRLAVDEYAFVRAEAETVLHRHRTWEPNRNTSN